MGEFSFGELVLVVIIAILVYGKDLPQAARKLAQVYSKLRRQLTDIKDEIQRQIPAEEIRESMKVNLPDDSLSADPPQPPQGLTASVTGMQVVLTWNSSAGATSYTVKRSYGNADPLMMLAGGVTDLSYTDYEIVDGTTYHYAVSAMNTAGESADSMEAVATVAPAAAPAPSPDAPAPAALASASPESSPAGPASADSAAAPAGGVDTPAAPASADSPSAPAGGVRTPAAVAIPEPAGEAHATAADAKAAGNGSSDSGGAGGNGTPIASAEKKEEATPP